MNDVLRLPVSYNLIIKSSCCIKKNSLLAMCYFYVKSKLVVKQHCLIKCTFLSIIKLLD